MSRISIYGSKRDRKGVLEYLQRESVIDITEAEAEGFERVDMSEKYSEFSGINSVGSKSLEVLERLVPESGGLSAALSGRTTLTTQEYYSLIDDIPEMLRIAKRINELSEKITEKQGNITKLSAEIEELSPWILLDTDMDGQGTKSCSCFVGIMGGEMTASVLYEKYNAEEVPAAYLEIISSSPQQTCIFVLCRKEDRKECEQRLRTIGFSYPKIVFEGVPHKTAKEKEKEISALKKEIKALEAEIISYSGTRNAIRFMADYYSMRAEKYSMLSRLSGQRHTFMIEGYVPTERVGELIAVLEHEYRAAVEVEAADENAPVMFKNPYLASPVEGIVKTFAMPGRGEIDPTTIMSFFYYIFFGLMLSDAGYGLIITIGCAAAMKKYKGMERDLKETLRMFMYCGISTMLWGVLFGSYFGDAVSVISSTFFGREISIPPLWFEPVNDPMRMLMYSFLFGLIHLFTALGIRLYQCIKAGDYMSALIDCIFWYMLVGGGVVYLFRMEMFLSMAGINSRLPSVWANAAAITAALGALGIFIFSGRGSSVGKRLAKGAYALYNVTGWLSDILSYSRLLALGLATGVIATVFNKMGSMFGGGVLGVILFIIIFVIGHTLNIGINLLGAYVHTNRLQFVEFFGKFYEGGGHEFRPFEADTKYYKIK